MYSFLCTPRALQRIPLILRVLFVHFKWRKGFWIVVGLTLGCGVGCMAPEQGPGWQKCVPAQYRLLSWGPYRVSRARAGRAILAGGFLFSVSSLPETLACAVQPNPATLWGWDAALCRRLMSLICCGVRTVKPGRAGLQLLPQKGWVFCSSQGLSVNPVQMSPNTSGQVKWH